jgi:hypothetical protein
MAHGGARKGAGRKKGVANKVTAQAKREALKSGITPLQYMLNVMRNPRADTKRRDDMAKAAAPFVHAQAIRHEGPGGGPLQIVDLTNATDEQLAALETLFGPLAAASGDDEGDPSGEAA